MGGFCTVHFRYYTYYCPYCREQTKDYKMEYEKKSSPAKEEKVDHPPHYTKGGIECIDGIKASMSLEAFEGYLKGNVIKYLWRYIYKNGSEDLKKAQWYLNKLVELKTK